MSPHRFFWMAMAFLLGPLCAVVGLALFGTWALSPSCQQGEVLMFPSNAMPICVPTERVIGILR